MAAISGRGYETNRLAFAPMAAGKHVALAGDRDTSWSNARETMIHAVLQNI
jgi:hypothetical protein